MRNGRPGTVRHLVSKAGSASLRSRGFVFITLVIVCPILLNGCSGLVTAGGKYPAVQTTFQLSPASISFGRVAVNKQAAQTITISNTGNTSVKITEVTISNPQFTVAGMTTPMSLGVGKSETFTVALTPKATGNLTGTMTVQGDGGIAPVVVNLSASAVPSQQQLSVSPGTIDFGSLSVGLKSSASLAIANLGVTDLTIPMITINGAEFTLGGISTPRTIGSGQSVMATVTFSPTAAGSANGEVSITSNDPNNPTVRISLIGNGSSAPTGQMKTNAVNVDFGTVAVGTKSIQQIQLTNSGNAAISITSIYTQGTGFTTSGAATPYMLNPSQTVAIPVAFAPTKSGSEMGSIVIVSNAMNSPLTIPLSGTAVQGGISVLPASFNFADVVNGQIKAQTFTVTNKGTAPLTISQLSVSGNGFSVSGLATPTTLAAGGSTTFSVLFAPSSAGSLAGAVTIYSNLPSSPETVTLMGTGVAASVTLSANPMSASFANINVGSTSAQDIRITNSGNASLTISRITVNAKDFRVTGLSVPTILLAGQTVAMTISFNPAVPEKITGNIEVMSSQGASAVIPVTGDAVQAGLTITPASASFSDVTVGSSNSQTIQLTNSGNSTLTITQVAVSGNGFNVETLALPITLAAGASNTFNIQFAPTSAGTARGGLSIVSNAPNSPALITLSGNGTVAKQSLSFSTTSLNFGSVNTGGSSTQTVAITNTGNSVVTVTQISESGTGFLLSGANTPIALNPAQSLTFGVNFSPSSVGSSSGSILVTSTASANATTIGLAGLGVQSTTHTVALNWNASTMTVSGYNVYRSTESGGNYIRINRGLVAGINYEDSDIQAGATYYYVTTAVDGSGNESSYSNEAVAVIP